jgi:hypothetical protein
MMLVAVIYYGFSSADPAERDPVTRGRKTGRLLLVVIVVVSLVAIAIPLCVTSACAHDDSAMPAMPSSTSLPHALQAVATGICDMAALTRTGLESLVPPLSASSLPPMAAIVALLAIPAVLFRRTTRRAAVYFARAMSPPGDLRGVRLLI